MKELIRACIILAMLAATPAAAFAGGDYLGDKACYACHKEIKQVYLLDIHGKIFTKNPRNDFEAKGCESCHGPGAKHKEAADLADKGEKVPLAVDYPFEKGAEFTQANNAQCLRCHEKGANIHWPGSPHEMSDVGCIDCHVIHAEEPVEEIDLCGRCHVQKRAQLQRSSHMPLREGKYTCSDCHNPHGSMGPSLLAQSSVNENCYGCHAEKRGPFIWEHAPVREHCTTCHDAHGSNYEPMLKLKNPYLCKTCHMDAFHPSALYDGANAASFDRHTVGKGCLNCHGAIHGSNHPAGARLTR